ncbi:MAG: hypothetical protein LBU25_00090 [Treponema sp.]|jgi:hypothetical protein|nr:hypothetical protein [Treponema sp.]
MSGQEEIVWPGVDPATGEFTNGSFSDPLVKPLFIPAETVNLILDNLAALITTLGGTPDNSSTNQVAAAIQAALALKAPIASPALTGVPTAPNAAAFNDYAAAFPASERPASLFGGTWSIVWDTEKVFFRTGGGQEAEDDRVNGYQGDAIIAHRQNKGLQPRWVRQRNTCIRHRRFTGKYHKPL